MNATSIKAFIAGLTIACVGFACGTDAESDLTGSSTPSATASTCPAPDLRPGYLPSGLTEVDREPLVGQPAYTKTWEARNIFVQLVAGISADRGDDPDADSTKVRDFDGQVGPIPLDGSDYLVVDWLEQEECGSHQFAVISRDVDEEELLKIANSLEEPGATDRY